jgi:hypothetical protein
MWHKYNSEKSKLISKRNYEKAKKDGRTKLHYRKAILKKNYNITLEQYDDMFDKQNGKCAICGTHQSKFKRRLSVDHDHSTNYIRGLLCVRCNNGLGNFQESLELFDKAKSYLKKEKAI